MPAHRAVLHDLVTHGLNPSKPHSRIASNGRLAGHDALIAEIAKEEPKLTVKKLVAEKATEAVVAPPVEEKKSDPVVDETPVLEEKVAEEVTVVASSKKGKFGKKSAETAAVEPTPETEKPVS